MGVYEISDVAYPHICVWKKRGLVPKDQTCLYRAAGTGRHNPWLWPMRRSWTKLVPPRDERHLEGVGVDPREADGRLEVKLVRISCLRLGLLLQVLPLLQLVAFLSLESVAEGDVDGARQGPACLFEIKRQSLESWAGSLRQHQSCPSLLFYSNDAHCSPQTS